MNKNIKVNIFRVQPNNSVLCGYFCTGFVDFMLAGKNLTNFRNMFSTHDFKQNDHVILLISKMNEIDKTNLTDQTKSRLEK